MSNNWRCIFTGNCGRPDRSSCQSCHKEHRHEKCDKCRDNRHANHKGSTWDDHRNDSYDWHEHNDSWRW